MKAILCIDDAVGETRRCMVDEKDRPFRLEIVRWSRRGKRVRLGERRWVRALAPMAGEGDWFVTSGFGDQAILRLGPKDKLVEGQLVAATVVAEAFADKGARFRLVPSDAYLRPPNEPGLIAPPEQDAFLDGVEIIANREGLAARETVDAAIEESSEKLAPIPGGGDLAIEPTRALTAIDVDTGANAIAAKSTLNFNKAAAVEAARQIGLRGIAGLVVIDFVSMPLKEDRARVVDALRSALAAWAVPFDKVGAISSFGLCEAAIPRGRQPVADALRAPGGERQALEALRLIELYGLAEPGKRIRARIGKEAEHWLASGAIDWEAALADRIGRRWTIETGVEPRGGNPEVWAES